jgi:sec-independent protein translocase protein TatA
MLLQAKVAVLLNLFAPEHMILIAFIVLLLFGGKKIPELMKGLGKGVREFNDAKDNVKREIESSIHDQPKKEETSASTSTSTPTAVESKG